MFKNSSAFLAVLTIAAVLSVIETRADESKTQTNANQTVKTKPAVSKGKTIKNRIPRTLKTSRVSIALGKKLYKQYQCFDCHSLAGKGCENGMKLDSIGSKRTKEFIRDHIVDPEKHFDKHAKAFETDLNLMPPQNLEPNEVESLVEYLHSLK